MHVQYIFNYILCEIVFHCNVKVMVHSWICTIEKLPNITDFANQIIYNYIHMDSVCVCACVCVCVRVCLYARIHIATIMIAGFSRGKFS